MLEFDHIEIKGERNLEDRRESFYQSGIRLLKGEGLKYSIYFDRMVFIKEVSIYLKIDEGIKLFRNGFQSWSPSFEIDLKTKIRKPLFSFLKNGYLDPAGNGVKDSYFFTYLKKNNEYIFLFPENFRFLIKFALLKNLLKITFEIGKKVKNLDLPFLNLIFYTHCLSREYTTRTYQG